MEIDVMRTKSYTQWKFIRPLSLLFFFFFFSHFQYIQATINNKELQHANKQSTTIANCNFQLGSNNNNRIGTYLQFGSQRSTKKKTKPDNSVSKNITKNAHLYMYVVNAFILYLFLSLSLSLLICSLRWE